MNDKEELLYLIEISRKVLIELAQQYNYNFQHPEVLAASQKLDELLLKAAFFSEVPPN
ncbi:aspartyl-phosphate phosphatase Spo0E family protein [Aneurinibacillus migulanus]|uniref:Spo0E like sporulation regulatory protein n=1 Tax=Aneurinibacillus migulanus TaxID=47500 RepID=A0A1G8ZZQ6_ANEMI|nr:aspartyl-phosphate phosphatase Spo0E family protein [Aneurinibacillus migulanus]MCP1358990.1 aspartyl-phosphate phosphatase Spo0E family protein [Aneurinibacillus migulanus]MED0894344.1 aspartyl-phosphate phosphatase Spo0E family protein [Aneurinibacillus migulanus]MED1616428.1 aspartyl-phosphate phosphatase Spo0E family protein [Aneurinibacillus migulanus]MED4729794.1 aspartyl-phosphate phosphatase Spo0E family protein [Aneurinibacillus migulanus]SDK20609.1 Spo0E like sporulation regulator